MDLIPGDGVARVEAEHPPQRVESGRESHWDPESPEMSPLAAPSWAIKSHCGDSTLIRSDLLLTKASRESLLATGMPALGKGVSAGGDSRSCSCSMAITPAMLVTVTCWHPNLTLQSITSLEDISHLE